MVVSQFELSQITLFGLARDRLLLGNLVRLYPSGGPMRTLTLTLVCCALLSAGCATTAQIQHQGKPLEQVMADYHAIKKGMTKDEVIAQLGAPNYVEGGVLHWMQ